MTWVRLDASFANHRKVGRVARALGLPEVVVRGMLVTLWTRILSEAPDGSLEGWSAEDVAGAASFHDVTHLSRGQDGTSPGHPGQSPQALVDALVEAELLDETPTGLVVHDWSDYCGLDAEAERRTKERDRKRDYRARQRAAVPDVPGTSRDVPGTVPDVPPERRGEERNTDSLRSSFAREMEPVHPELQGFVLRDGTETAVTLAKVAQLAETYPTVDIVARLRASKLYAADELGAGRLKRVPSRAGFAAWLSNQCRAAAERGMFRRGSGQPPRGPGGGGRAPTVAERLLRRAQDAEQEDQAPPGWVEDDRRLEGNLVSLRGCRDAA